MNRISRNPQWEIGTAGSTQCCPTLRVDRYGYGFGHPRSSRLWFWTGLELHQPIRAVWTLNAARLSTPVANIQYHLLNIYKSSLTELSSLSLTTSSEITSRRLCSACNHFNMVMSCLHLRCWYIDLFICWQQDCAFWKSGVDSNEYHDTIVLRTAHDCSTVQQLYLILCDLIFGSN